jgi:hypothetical protein
MSQAKRDFGKTFDYSYPLVVSASQCETFQDCPRKWWLGKVQRLKEPLKDSTERGDVFHEVCERWLEADDRADVDPFPEGWDDRISPVDAALIKVVFQQFVDRGILVRTPGRQVEKPFQIPVLDGVSMIGFIDVLEPTRVTDHKTTSAPRYMKTADGLAKNFQMVIYGCAAIAEYLRRKDPPPDTITLRHNQAFLPKPDSDDLPFVRATEVDVTPEYIVDFWDREIVPLAEKMLHWKRAGLAPDQWGKLPGPKRKGICRKYGGCPYQQICGGTETPDDYKARVTRHNDSFLATVELETEAMSNTADILANLAKKKKAARAAAPAVDPNPTVVETIEEPMVEETSVADVAPWANPECLACGGTGINSKGNACPPCQAATGVTSAGYEIDAGDGALLIVKDGVLVAEIQVAEGAVEKPARTVAKKVVEPEPETPVEAKKAEKVAKTEAATKAAERPNAGKRGRPKQGFTLLYGVQKRGKAKVIDLEMVLQEFGKLLAEEWGGAGYYSLDAFKRRDALAHKAPEIAESFGPAIVQVTSDSPDVRAFAAALEPLASAVIVGISR